MSHSPPLSLRPVLPNGQVPPPSQTAPAAPTPPTPSATAVALLSALDSCGPELDSACADRARALVFDFLLRSCHRRAAVAFAGAAGLPTVSSPEMERALRWMDLRSKMSKLLYGGDVLGTLQTADGLLEEVAVCTGRNFGSGGLRSLRPDLFFELACQHFIERVRAGSEKDALLYAHEVLSPLARNNQGNMETLRSITVLIAYGDPERSPAGGLLALERRGRLASLLNDELFNLCRAEAGPYPCGLDVVLGQLRELSKMTSPVIDHLELL